MIHFGIASAVHDVMVLGVRIVGDWVCVGKKLYIFDQVVIFPIVDPQRPWTPVGNVQTLQVISIKEAVWDFDPADGVNERMRSQIEYDNRCGALRGGEQPMPLNFHDEVVETPFDIARVLKPNTR